MKLGVTTIQRDRGPWLPEWVAFHSLVGFNKFYIFLHKCSDNSEEIIKRLKKRFDIKIFVVDPSLEKPQLKCYQKSYEKFGDEVDWMAFIDGDEFFFTTTGKSIENELKKYSNKELSAIGVYWSCFGSSGFLEEPKGLMIENFKHRASNNYENNRHIKSIVKGKQGKSVIAIDPHMFQTPLGTYDEGMRPIEKGWTDYQPTYKHFRINHYATQSREFFVNFKSKIIPADGAAMRDESFWKEHNKNDVLDNSLDRFIGPLKKLLKTL